MLYADDAAARLFEVSAAADAVMREQPPAVRRAVALGRQLLDPMAVASSLFGPDAPALALPLHPLQARTCGTHLWDASAQRLHSIRHPARAACRAGARGRGQTACPGCAVRGRPPGRADEDDDRSRCPNGG